MKSIKKYSYGKQYLDLCDIWAVLKTLRSNFLTQGPKVAEFEKAICDYTGAKYSVALANGTAALHLAMLALEIKKGDEVITSGMDNIFFEGLKVGRVIQVTDLTDMKIATVKPYVNVLKKKYFYTYKSDNEVTNNTLEKSETKK